MSPDLPKVLIVTYYFPPAGGAGVQRTLKFVKYLRCFGWEPVVLTARNADYPVYDESLSAEIPEGVEVCRSRILEPYTLYRKLTGRSKDDSTDIATLSLDGEAKARTMERMAEFIRSAFFVPDARIGWRRFATRAGRELIRRQEIRAIISSAPPYTTHLIGLDLHKKSGLPWIVDFRDSWVGWVSAPQWRPWPSRQIERRMEASVLKMATRILTVSAGVRDDLLSRNPGTAGDRWHILTNGFDADDFAGIEPAPRPEKVTLTYTGSMYGARNPEHLLRTLERLQPELASRLFFRIVGRVGDPIKRRIADSPRRDLFEFIPYVTHEESLSYLVASDVLLLIIDDAPANRGILTGKLFEYIGAGKPILALAPEGEAATLIRENQLGWVAGPRDSTAIERALRAIMDACGQGQMTMNRDEAVRNRFDRRKQTEELARILDEVTSQPEKGAS